MNSYTNLIPKNPKLIEPGISYWLNNVLNKSKKYREKNINLIFNLVMLILFILIVSLFLIYKYKGNISQKEKSRKNAEKKNYILSKLQNLATIRKENMKNETLITDLPLLDSPELKILNK